MTGTDLRSAIDEELRDLEPMPSVVPEVLAEGATRQRRRRTVGSALAAAAVAGIVGVGAATLPGILDEDAPRPEVTGTAAIDDRREFLHWATDKLDAALPARIGGVRVLDKNAEHDFVVDAAGMRVEFDLSLYPAGTPHSPADADTYISLVCRQTGDDDCVTAPNGNAIVYRQNGGFHSSGDSVPNAVLNVDLRDHSEVADSAGLYFAGERPPRGPVPLTDEELFELAASPQFERIWREYARHPEWMEPVD